MSFLKKCQTCNTTYTSMGEFENTGDRWKLCSKGHLWFNCRCGSTLMIKNENSMAAYRLALKSPIIARKLLQNFVKNKLIPQISNNVILIQKMLTNEAINYKLIAQLLKYEPFIANELLVLANKELSASTKDSTNKIQDIQHAIVYVGQKKVSQLLTIACVKSINIHSQKFSISDFWFESFLRARIFEYICRKCFAKLSPDEAFLVGFFMHIGKFVNIYYHQDKVERVADAYKENGNDKTWSQLEQEYEVHPSNIVGVIASSYWNLPEIIDILDEHMIEKVKNTVDAEVEDIALFADQLTYTVTSSYKELRADLLIAIQKKLNISVNEMQSIIQEAKGMSQYL